MSDKWGKWVASKCTRYFDSSEEAVTYLRERNFTGKVLETPEGIMAVCCAYPDGFYDDATTLIDICDEDGIDPTSPGAHDQDSYEIPSNSSHSCCEPEKSVAEQPAPQQSESQDSSCCGPTSCC